MPSISPSTRAVASRSCILILAFGWIGITAALFGIGELVVHSHVIMEFDRNVTNSVVNHRTPALNAAMRAITWIGSWVAVAVTGAVMLVLIVAKRLTMAHLLVLALAWAGEYTMVNLVKYAVGRPRPPEVLWLVAAHGSSFPSGHAANATVVCAAGTLIAFLFAWRRTIRAATVTLACLLITAVGFSRVELGVHWTTDVIAGSLITVVWLAVIARQFAGTVHPPVPDHDE